MGWHRFVWWLLRRPADGRSWVWTTPREKHDEPDSFHAFYAESLRRSHVVGGQAGYLTLDDEQSPVA